MIKLNLNFKKFNKNNLIIIKLNLKSMKPYFLALNVAL